MSRITDEIDAAGETLPLAQTSFEGAVVGADAAMVRAALEELERGADVATAARAAVHAAPAHDLALSAILFSVHDAQTTAWISGKNTSPLDVVHGIGSYLGTVDDGSVRTTLPMGARFVVPVVPMWGGYRGHAVFLPPRDREALTVAVALRILEEVVEPEPDEPAAIHAVVESLRHALTAVTDSADEALSDRSIDRAIARLGDVASHGSRPEPRNGRSIAIVDAKGNACVLACGPEAARLPTPAIVDRGGRPWILIATEVDSATSVVGLVHAVVDRRVDPSVAVASARFSLGPGAEIVFEADVEPHVHGELLSRGHDVRTVTRGEGVLSLLVVDEEQRRHAIADARVKGEGHVVPAAQRGNTSDQP